MAGISERSSRWDLSDEQKMSLRILSVSYPFAVISSGLVGGAEQILHHLDAALVDNHHKSIVIGNVGSRVRGTLVEVPAVTGKLPERLSGSGQRTV